MTFTPGLVFAESLTISAPHGLMLLLSLTLLLGWPRVPLWQRMALCQIGLLWVTWGDAGGLDARLLMAGARRVARFSWGQALAEWPFIAYLRYQPPFVPFLISRLPSPGVWRVAQAAWLVLLCALLPRRAHGFAMPITLLLWEHPCVDVWALGLCLCAQAARREGVTWLAYACWSLAFWVKPLTLVTLPMVIVSLRWGALPVLLAWGGYYAWARGYRFGNAQAGFLAAQTVIAQAAPTTWAGVLRWRWAHLGRGCLTWAWAAWFPAWLAWRGLLFGAVIAVGYGNLKYGAWGIVFAQDEET